MACHVAHAGVQAGVEPPVEVLETHRPIGGRNSDQIEALIDGPQLELVGKFSQLLEYGMRLPAGAADVWMADRIE